MNIHGVDESPAKMSKVEWRDVIHTRKGQKV